jgi:hypothetical protein
MEEVQLKKLSHTWVLSEVKRDDTVDEGFDNFELTLSGSAGANFFTYGTSGRPAESPWPSGGTWAFGPTITSQLIRDPASDDEVIISYNLSGETLEMEFDFSGSGYAGGRTQAVEGHWVFTFTR